MNEPQSNPARRQPIKAMKHEVLRYCRHQLESLFVRAALAEPGTRGPLIAEWHQVKINRDYIQTLNFKGHQLKIVQKMDECSNATAQAA